jgi:AraC-like DNA-binding protein
MREKFGRPTARRTIFGDRREFWPRHPFKIDMAFAPRHENKGAAKANLIANRNFAFDKSAVAATAQHSGADFNFARQRPRKGDLRREKGRQIGRGELSRMIGERRTQPAIGGAALMPCSRNIDAVALRARLHLLEYLGEVHKPRLSAGRKLRKPKDIMLASAAKQCLEDDPKIGDFAIFDWINSLITIRGELPHDTVSMNLIGRIIKAGVAAGARRPEILEGIGLEERTLRNQLNRANAQVLVRLFAEIERQAQEPGIALLIGRDSKPSCFSDIGYATRLLPTLEDMLAVNVEMQLLRQNVYQVQLVETEDALRLQWEIFGHDREMLSAAIEFSIGTYARLARENIGRNDVVTAIVFAHRPRMTADRYREILSHEPLFGGDMSYIDFAKDHCRAPSPWANVELVKAANAAHMVPMEWWKSGREHSAHTYFYLWTELNKSALTLDRVAQSFSLSERTLRRNLVNEGMPYRELLDDVRRRMCDLYRLEGTRSLSTVAELLGYGELSAFTRAHKRWYGGPPSQHWK